MFLINKNPGLFSPLFCPFLNPRSTTVVPLTVYFFLLPIVQVRQLKFPTIREGTRENKWGSVFIDAKYVRRRYCYPLTDGAWANKCFDGRSLTAKTEPKRYLEY